MRNMEDKIHAKQYMECNHCGELIPEKPGAAPIAASYRCPPG